MQLYSSYIILQELKELLYLMIEGETSVDSESVSAYRIIAIYDVHAGATGLTVYPVNTEVQDKFFSEVNNELQKVEGFFRGSTTLQECV